MKANTLMILGIIIGWIIGVLPIVSLGAIIYYLPTETLAHREVMFCSFSVLALACLMWLFGSMTIIISWINEFVTNRNKDE